MANVTTWIWAITGLYTTTLNGQSNVVNSVLYSLTGTDGTNTQTVTGNQPIVFNSENSFVPYANLTQDQIISWIKSVLGENGIAFLEKQIQEKINAIENPVVIPSTTALPW